MTDTEEMRLWLKENREFLAKYDADEMAWLAFQTLPWIDRMVVYEVLSHINDAKAGSNFDNRAKFHIWHETEGIERLSPQSLKEQWFDLGKHLVTGRCWDDVA